MAATAEVRHEDPVEQPAHPLHEFWFYFSENKGAVAGLFTVIAIVRSEERRVGKECRSRWSPCH